MRDLLRQGKAIGCFIEVSPPCARCWPNCRPTTTCAWWRPAPSSVRRLAQRHDARYIERYRNPELRKKRVLYCRNSTTSLHETYGVMVYQEDVIRVACSSPDSASPEADHLDAECPGNSNSATSSEGARNFFINCRKRLPKKLIEDIWMQIESFAITPSPKGTLPAMRCGEFSGPLPQKRIIRWSMDGNTQQRRRILPPRPLRAWSENAAAK